MSYYHTIPPDVARDWLKALIDKTTTTTTSFTFPVNDIVWVIFLPHHHTFLQVIEASGFRRILPAQVQTPPDLVGVVLQTPVRNAVVEQHHASKGHLTSHHVLLQVCTQTTLHLLLLHLYVPGGSSTAGVSGRDAWLVPS